MIPAATSSIESSAPTKFVKFCKDLKQNRQGLFLILLIQKKLSTVKLTAFNLSTQNYTC